MLWIIAFLITLFVIFSYFKSNEPKPRKQIINRNTKYDEKKIQENAKKIIQNLEDSRCPNCGKITGTKNYEAGPSLKSGYYCNYICEKCKTEWRVKITYDEYMNRSK